MAGRWSLFRQLTAGTSSVSPGIGAFNGHGAGNNPESHRDAALEMFARVLLRRYGVMFRRLLERESLQASWYDLGRTYRRMEARGEIRGGYFVSGVSGEQFALPEAIGSLRSLRKAGSNGGDSEWISISAADPLNLAGILTPGPRITAIAGNRLLLHHGVPVAALQAGQVMVLDASAGEPPAGIERALRVGRMPATLRRYYG
jgi:ATP-dependent Lhr-like helicase